MKTRKHEVVVALFTANAAALQPSPFPSVPRFGREARVFDRHPEVMECKGTAVTEGTAHLQM